MNKTKVSSKIIFRTLFVSYCALLLTLILRILLAKNVTTVKIVVSLSSENQIIRRAFSQFSRTATGNRA